MHRNTYTLVIVLAIFAALVAGVNIGKKLSEPQQVASEQQLNTPTLAQLAPTKNIQEEYTSKGCAITFPIPEQFTITSESTLSAMFTRSDQKTSIIVTCQKNIPRPPIPTGSIETVKLTSLDKTTTISAKLYHDQSPSDGEKIDALIFYNPKIKMDVIMAGYGSEFDSTLNALHILLE